MQTATMQDAPGAPLLAAGHAGGSTEKAAGGPVRVASSAGAGDHRRPHTLTLARQ